MLLCTAAFTVLMFEAFAKANVLAEKIVYGEIPYDINVIRKLIPSTLGVVPENCLLAATALIFAVWFVSCVDAYRIGRSNGDS